MPPPFPGGETITLRRVIPLTGQYDDFGVLKTTTKDSTVPGAAIYPNSSTEVTQGQERTRIAYNVLLPTTVNVDAVDRIVWRNREYEVEGEPERFQSPFTDTQLQTLLMYRVEG